MSHQLLSDFDLSRRRALLAAGGGLGSIALGTLLNPAAFAGDAPPATAGRQRIGGLPDCPHFTPKAKRVI